MRDEQELQRQAQALPFLGEGDTHVGSSKPSGREIGGFTAIIKIFVRTWPYLLPHIVGYWRELGTAESADPMDANAASDTGVEETPWRFSHTPPLLTLLVALGPFVGLIPLGTTIWLDGLWYTSVVIALLAWGSLFATGRLYVIAAAGLVTLGGVSLLTSIFVVDGYADNVYMTLIVLATVSLWVVQYRLDAGKVQVRVRLGSHMVYYFVLLSASTLLTLILALFSVDLISQSILQAEPLTPFLAEFLGQPELAGTTQTSLDAANSSDQANIGLAPLTAEQRHSLTWVYGVFMIFVWLVQIPTMMLLPYYYIFIMQRVNQDLRMALLERWHRLSLRYHSDHRVGDSVYRIYQDSAQVTAVVGMVTQALQLLVTYVTGVFFLLGLDPLLGIMTLSVVVLAMLWGFWYSPRMRVKSLASREANSDFTSRVQETFAAVRLLKACGTGAAEQRRLENDSVAAFNASYRVRTLMAIVGIIMFSLAAGVLLAGQFFTAVWAFGERETFASVLVALVGLSFLKWNLSAYQSAQEQLGLSSVAVRDLVEKWTQAQDMAMGLNRVFDILDIEPDVQNRPHARPLAPFRDEIRFDGVDFRYEPDRPVLNDVTFAVKPGSITAIVGPTGSGKSSLVSLLCRLFDPDAGSISIDGVDLRDLDVESLRHDISVALQENVLFGMSLRDNIRYVAPEINDADVMAAAHVACIDDYINQLPDGLDTVLSDRGGKLSTGQRQRLSIARAIAKDTPILVLDEPTAALDARTEHSVLERLSAWGSRRAIFVITHRISTIQKADRILYLDRGRIIENGSHDELMQIDGGHYRNFVETETRLSKRAMRSQASA
ncbi:MAG: ABC transporter ATP-binding protein [Gammaproteobacteria bacterium]|nr:ABC transporter ATP-binding protein [Gammaproteobacteria bacterium]